MERKYSLVWIFVRGKNDKIERMSVLLLYCIYIMCNIVRVCRKEFGLDSIIIIRSNNATTNPLLLALVSSTVQCASTPSFPFSPTFLSLSHKI
jgi:hypothetical protein